MPRGRASGKRAAAAAEPKAPPPAAREATKRRRALAEIKQHDEAQQEQEDNRKAGEKKKGGTKKEKNKKEPAELRWKVDGIKNKPKSAPVNICSVLSLSSSKLCSHNMVAKAARSVVMDKVKQFAVYNIVHPFTNRVTCMSWHPDENSLCAVGDKNGDLVLWDVEGDRKRLQTAKTSESQFKSFIKGSGPGNNIHEIRFDQLDYGWMFVSSMDGTISRKDFSGQNNQVLMTTHEERHNWDNWFNGMDVSFSGKTVVAGDNLGWVNLCTLNGEKVWKLRLHKGKVHHVQFSPREPWLMLTTSVEGNVKIWDIRKISGRESSIATLDHDKPVNSAYFSNVTGDKLLTTDQHSQLRIYQGPYFTLDKVIEHPHRQFQHLTPIRANWHPLVDIVFAGRYPDPKFPSYEEGEPRSIDFFDPDTGQELHRLHQPGIDKIASLCTFSPNGDYLISSFAQSVAAWKMKPVEEYDESDQTDGPSSSALWPRFDKQKPSKKANQKKKK